jgi:hypothetical protein
VLRGGVLPQGDTGKYKGVVTPVSTKALHLPPSIHLLIVNKLSLSLSLPAEEADESGLRQRRDDRSTPYHSHCLVRACVCAFVGEFAHVSIHFTLCTATAIYLIGQRRYSRA